MSNHGVPLLILASNSRQPPPQKSNSFTIPVTKYDKQDWSNIDMHWQIKQSRNFLKKEFGFSNKITFIINC